MTSGTFLHCYHVWPEDKNSKWIQPWPQLGPICWDRLDGELFGQTHLPNRLSLMSKAAENVSFLPEGDASPSPGLLTCLTQDASVTRFTHTGETVSALNTQRVVEARPVFALVNVCNTHRGTERHAHGIFTQLINISAILLHSLCKYVLLAVKGIRRGLIHLHRLDCGNRSRSTREAGPSYFQILNLKYFVYVCVWKLLNERQNTLINEFFQVFQPMFSACREDMLHYFISTEKHQFNLFWGIWLLCKMIWTVCGFLVHTVT